jgi:4-hydroxy-4-methyl-2-oxoglutarate aldolase
MRAETSRDTELDFFMSFPHISQDILDTLARYDSATVCNVIELFGIRPATAGYTGSAIRALYPELPPVVGLATTATFRSAYPSQDKDVYLRFPEHLRAMQDLPTPRIVVTQDLDERPSGAAVGEITCRAYQRFGCGALITNGAARDILQVGALKFPVFASTVNISHAHTRLEDIHVAVNINGLTVRPGDLLHADVNGVVSIPIEIAAGVAAACGDYMDVEQRVVAYLNRPDVTVEGYRRAEEQAAAEMDKMAIDLRAKA